MKKKKTNIWLILGVTIICILLLYWLFAATLINEDENFEENPPVLVEPNE